MRNFSICVETGPTGNDYFTIEQSADTLEAAIELATPRAREMNNGRAILISAAACSELAS